MKQFNLRLPCRFLLIAGLLIAMTVHGIEGSAQSKPAVQPVTVSGLVTDANNVPLPGALVAVRGGTAIVYSDSWGRYSISVPQGDDIVLQVSYLGYDTKSVTVTKSGEVNVKLKEQQHTIDEVVVTGMTSVRKDSYTGSVTQIKGEDLLKVSSTNIIAAVAALTPGMQVIQNNIQGSNPNAIPEFLINGRNSLVTSAEEAANNYPLIVLDGVVITIQEFYDLDMFDIESVTVLKDASAAVLWGDRAANGVIVIERTRVKEAEPRLRYNFTPSYSFADLSSLNLANAAQKLELERLYGLYDTPNGSLDRAYAHKLENIRRGVDTRWYEAPLRISFGHQHSLSLTGMGNKIEYRAGANFNDSYGIMKGDNRRTFGVNFGISYRAVKKLTVSFKSSYSLTDAKGSPYGDFYTYTRMNPYESPWDENGDLVPVFYFDPYNTKSDKMDNPLYNARLSSFSKNRSQTFRNSLDAKWEITKLFSVEGHFDISLNNSRNDDYTSPEDTQYITTDNLLDKGNYGIRIGDGFEYNGRINANYGLMLDKKGSSLRLTVGSNISRKTSNGFGSTFTGILRDNLSDISFAQKFRDRSNTGQERISATASFFATANLVLFNRYTALVSVNMNGSSANGRDRLFSTKTSLGLRWNINREGFMKDVKWIDDLYLRANIGSTGAQTVNIYQAQTVYDYMGSGRNPYDYYTGIGAVPIQMGNPNLKGARVLSTTVGLNAGFLGRLNIEVEYFRNKTKDLTMSITMPASVGSQSLMLNFGEITNSGYRASIAASIFKGKNFGWYTSLSAGHTNDKITRISNALKRMSYANPNQAGAPKVHFIEGGSQGGIYTMRSAGIDPATGQEIFIKKDGTYTFEYSKNEIVQVGNTNPVLYGAWNNTFRYKGFSLNITTSYTFGGDIYNSTLRDKVELIDPRYNVDARAFTDRWKKPGDLSRYLGIGGYNIENISDSKSERFVERNNELVFTNIELAYEFEADFLKRIRIKRLRLGLSMSDAGRLSTVRMERGTSYPYCRTIGVTISPTF